MTYLQEYWLLLLVGWGFNEKLHGLARENGLVRLLRLIYLGLVHLREGIAKYFRVFALKADDRAKLKRKISTLKRLVGLKGS